MSTKDEALGENQRKKEEREKSKASRKKRLRKLPTNRKNEVGNLGFSEFLLSLKGKGPRIGPVPVAFQNWYVRVSIGKRKKKGERLHQTKEEWG